MLIVSVLELFFTFGLICTTCELCQKMTDKFEAIDDQIIRWDWFSLPMKTQRWLPIIMMNTQQSFDLVCFGSILCNRDTCKKVNSNSFPNEFHGNRKWKTEKWLKFILNLLLFLDDQIDLFVFYGASGIQLVSQDEHQNSIRRSSTTCQ